MNRTRRDFLRMLGGGAAGMAAASLLTAEENVVNDTSDDNTRSRPNIIVIFADDLGYGDAGCYGATHVKTPNIDALAREGMRFTDAHAASAVCTPT